MYKNSLSPVPERIGPHIADVLGSHLYQYELHTYIEKHSL